MTLFEGREVDGITVKVKALEVATHDTFHLGAEVYVLTRATIVAIEHPDKDGSLFRCQVAKPEDGWLVPQLTAARMIDAVEPPKLPGTERVRDKSKDATIDIEVGDDGSVTFIDTTTGEKHTAAPDDESAALARNEAADPPALTDEQLQALADADTSDANAEAAVTEPAVEDVVQDEFEVGDAEPGAGPIDAPQHDQGGTDGAETENKIEAAADKPASMIQRVALTKNILAFTEKLTEDFLAWQRKNKIPLNPEHMTFEEARRCLVYVGDIRNAGAE